MIVQVTQSLFEVHDEQGVAVEQFEFKQKQDKEVSENMERNKAITQ